MSDPWNFQFDTEKVEKSFSSLQPVDDAVQSAESPAPGCCTRTTLAVRCRALARGYVLDLPLKSRKANETPDTPPQNRQLHVMTAQIPPPMFQVLSVREGKEVAEIEISGQGANQCPPGMPNRVKVDGIGGGVQDVPFTQWSVKAPALLDARLLDPLDEDMISFLHPFKAPDLPAQVWTVAVPGCPSARLKASVAAFPDVRWSGRLALSAVPKPASHSGFEIEVGGDLACRYNGSEFKITTREQARALCKWFDCLEMLARCTAALASLKPGPKHAGIDNPRLIKHEELRLEPWPRLSLQVDSALIEQEGNGLLGHALKVLVSGDPVMGAEGEVSLLPSWLEDSTKKRVLAPLVAALDVVRVEEITQELGLWLVAQGRASLRAGVEARRPAAGTAVLGRAAGGIALHLEVRSIREYETFLTRCGGAEDATVPAGLQVGCEAPSESPLPEPRDKKCRALFAFSGCAVGPAEKWRPGCRFRRWQAAGVKPAGAVPLAPARSWPGGAAPGDLVEVPWCD